MTAWVLAKFLSEVGRDKDLFDMKSVWNQHPTFLSIALANRGQELLIVRKSAGDGHSLHISCGDGVDKSFFLVDGIAKASGDKVRKTDPEGIALCFCGEPKGGNDFDFGLGKILVAMNTSPADDVGIHPRSAVSLSDIIDNKNVYFLRGEGGKVVAMSFEKGGFSGQDLVAHDGMDFSGLIESILQDGEACENLSGLDEKGAHFIEDTGHTIGSGRVEGFGRADFAHSYDHHLGETALHRAGKAGVEFNAIEDQDTGGFEAVAVHPNIP